MAIVWENEPGRASGGVGGGAAAAMGASLNTKDVNSMASEAKKMLDSARSGGFRVSEEAAQPIRRVLKDMQDEVRRMSQNLRKLAQKEPSLGGHPYGKDVAAFQQRAATVEPNSPAVVLQQLEQVLFDADKALEIAVNKYRESEESATSSLKAKQV